MPQTRSAAKAAANAGGATPPAKAAATKAAAANKGGGPTLGAGWAGGDGAGSGVRGGTIMEKVANTLFTVFLMVSTPPFAIVLCVRGIIPGPTLPAAVLCAADAPAPTPRHATRGSHRAAPRGGLPNHT